MQGAVLTNGNIINKSAIKEYAFPLLRSRFFFVIIGATTIAIYGHPIHPF